MYCDKHRVNSPCMECLMAAQAKQAEEATNRIIEAIMARPHHFGYNGMIQKVTYTETGIHVETIPMHEMYKEPKLTLRQRIAKILGRNESD